MRKIRVLDLSYNQISYMSTKVFNWCKDIYSVDISNNQLKKLDLSENYRLLVVTLRLDNNLISEISGELTERLPYLQTLSATYNPLTKITARAFQYSELIDISLGCCQVTAIDSNVRPHCYNTSIEVENGAFAMRSIEYGGRRDLKRLRLLGCFKDLGNDVVGSFQIQANNCYEF